MARVSAWSAFIWDLEKPYRKLICCFKGLLYAQNLFYFWYVYDKIVKLNEPTLISFVVADEEKEYSTDNEAYNHWF